LFLKGAQGFAQFPIIMKALERDQNPTDRYKIRAAVPKVLPVPNVPYQIKECLENGQAFFGYLIAEQKAAKIMLGLQK
jgi:hypothetical protein